MDRLEIPDHYLRDAGMESYAEQLWQSLKSSQKASFCTFFSCFKPGHGGPRAYGARLVGFGCHRGPFEKDFKRWRRWKPPKKLVEKINFNDF